MQMERMFSRISKFLKIRIYIAEVDVNGLTYQSEFAVVEAGMTELILPPIVVYATTEDILHSEN